MIEYTPDKFQVCFIWRLQGSVFPYACAYAIPAAMIAYFLKTAQVKGVLQGTMFENVLTNNAAYSGFSFVVGFLLVFRTSQAYSRFWEGATKIQMMQAKWLDGFGSLISFTR